MIKVASQGGTTVKARISCQELTDGTRSIAASGYCSDAHAAGMILASVRGEEFRALPEAEKRRIKHRVTSFKEELEKVIRQVRNGSENREKLKELNRQGATFAR